jgi:hypothetical protein
VTVTDFPDWQTPQAHADRIAATGAPLLRLSQSVKFNIGTTIGGGASTTLLTAGAFTQPGYEIGVRASMPASSGTLPFVALELLWSDATTSLATARRDVVVTAGNGPTNQIISYINGPARGDNLKVIATNVDPAVAVTLDWTIKQTSHVYEHDQAGQQAYVTPAPNGFTNPMGVSGTDVIAWFHPTLGAGASSSALCALYGGDAFLMIDDVGISAPVTVALTDAAGYATGTTAGEFYGTSVPAAGSLEVELTLPFSPVLLSLTNTATSGLVAPKAALLAQNH